MFVASSYQFILLCCHDDSEISVHQCSHVWGNYLRSFHMDNAHSNNIVIYDLSNSNKYMERRSFSKIVFHIID